MTPEEIQTLKAELKAEIAKLEAQIEGFKEDSGPVAPDQALGRLTRLDEMQAKSVKQAAIRDAEEKLNKARYRLMTIGTPLFEG